MKLNKAFLQLVAAIWIFIFHLWIPVTGLEVELFIQKIGYVGVDIFFFVSAYSLAGKDIEYKSFIKNRFAYIWGKFVVFALIAALIKHWSISKFFKTVFFADFFTRGGGSFLWFVPAILIVYLLYPLFMKWQWKGKIPFVLLLWFVLCFGLSEFAGYKTLLIFGGRLPAILAGYLLKKKELPKWSGPVLLVIGTALLLLFGYKTKLNMPWKEFYFVLGVVFVVGLAQMSRYIKDSKALTLLASCSLELYAFQMIVGPSWCTKLYALTASPLLTNLAGLVILILLSLAVSQIFTLAWKKAVTKL